MAGYAPVSNTVVVLDGTAYAAGRSIDYVIAISEATHVWHVISVNVLIGRMSVLDAATLTEVALVGNTLGRCAWMPTGLMYGVDYVLQIEVQDHASLATNKIFISNVFKTLPEPVAASILLIGCILARPRR